MPKLRLLFLVTSCAAVLAAAACGDDDNVVRGRPGPSTPPVSEGGVDGGPDGPVNTCGISLPATYASPGYDTNAGLELSLRSQFDAFLKPMRDAEVDFGDGGASGTPVTKALLTNLYTTGSPNVRGTTTGFYQAKVDAWIQEYEDAFGDGAWVPKDPPEAAEKGGVYGKYMFNARGIDLRQAIEKGTYIAAFYNHAITVLAAGPPTEGTIDRLVAAFGAHPSFPGDPNAANNKDVNSAAVAAHRSTDPNRTGPYPKIKAALIRAKASIAAGEKCNADRDEALKTFFSEWERSSFATVVHDFYRIINTDLPGAKYPDALHGLGESLGLIAGFRTLPQERRIITDAQIDKMLTDALSPNGAPAVAYKLETSPLQSVAGLQQVISDIKTVYAFSDEEMTSFRTFD